VLGYGEHSAGLWGAQCWAMGSTVLGYGEHRAGLWGAQCWAMRSKVLGYEEHSAGWEAECWAMGSTVLNSIEKMATTVSNLEHSAELHIVKGKHNTALWIALC
jgi:hypothetical protein